MRTAKRRTSSYVVKLEPEQLAQLQLELRGPPRSPRPPAPTIAEVVERFMTWSRANRQKPSTLATKETLWRCHLEPRLGTKRADQLQHADVEALKAQVGKLSAKRVNTLLSVLRKALKLAVKRGELEKVPCEIDAVPETEGAFDFYDFDVYRQLVAGAAKVGLRELVVVLLGGDAGLRMGEQLGLQRGDVDLVRRQLHVRRSDSNGELVAPKGGRSRVVPLTQLLVDALGVLFGRSSSTRSDARVLVSVAGGWMVKPAEIGKPLTVQRIRTLMERAQRAAGLEVTGNMHVLRHTFCSHLAMRGASTVAIKNLAGHVSISTTEKYMHLADPERQRAVALLDQARASVAAATGERSQRSEPIGLSDSPHSNAGLRANPQHPQEASGTPESAALTPRRFELLRVESQSQVEWLEHVLGSFVVGS